MSEKVNIFGLVDVIVALEYELANESDYAVIDEIGKDIIERNNLVNDEEVSKDLVESILEVTPGVFRIRSKEKIQDIKPLTYDKQIRELPIIYKPIEEEYPDLIQSLELEEEELKEIAENLEELIHAWSKIVFNYNFALESRTFCDNVIAKPIVVYPKNKKEDYFEVMYKELQATTLESNNTIEGYIVTVYKIIFSHKVGCYEVLYKVEKINK